MSDSSHATALFVASGVAALGMLSGCGGTSGRENIPNGGNLPSAIQDATAGVDALAPEGGFDATLGDSAGDDSGDAGFDVQIAYADADRLPHFEGGASSGDSGPEAAGPPPPWANWPACACDDSTNPSVPAVPDKAGTCPTFVWTRSAQCDTCIRNSNCDGFAIGAGKTYLFPPCCDLSRDGGVATQGPGTSLLKFQLCADLYSCILAHVNEANNIEDLYCGAGVGTGTCADPSAGGPQGLCKAQVEAAFESTDPSFIIGNLTTAVQGHLGSEGIEVTSFFACALDTRNAAAANNCAGVCFRTATDAGAADVSAQ